MPNDSTPRHVTYSSDNIFRSTLPANPVGAEVPRGTPPAGEERPGATSSGAVGAGASPGARARAERLIGYIGAEFNKLRRKGRASAWADLEEKVAEGGELLVSVGMMDPPGWIKLMIDIEQFRKSEGGSEELPGDALAKWLSEPGPKDKSKPKPKPPAIVDVPIKRSKSASPLVAPPMAPSPASLVLAESADDAADPEFTLPDEES